MAALQILRNPPDAELIRFVAGGGLNQGHALEIKNIFPANYATDDHTYMIKLNRGTAELYVNNHLAAVQIWCPTFRSEYQDVISENSEPYAIGLVKCAANPIQPVFIEGYSEDVDMLIPFEYRHFRFSDGQPNPPRTYPLYDYEASTLLTEGTYDTGTSYKSHPVPVQGYRAKAFLFRADTDSVADGLAVEVYTQEGNWRTYLTRTYSAGDLESIEPAGEFPLMRLAYEPAADGASITVAEATVR